MPAWLALSIFCASPSDVNMMNGQGASVCSRRAASISTADGLIEAATTKWGLCCTTKWGLCRTAARARPAASSVSAITSTPASSRPSRRLLGDNGASVAIRARYLGRSPERPPVRGAQFKKKGLPALVRGRTMRMRRLPGPAPPEAAGTCCGTAAWCPAALPSPAALRQADAWEQATLMRWHDACSSSDEAVPAL